ncbi:hypothetical protein [Caballeronia sp. HLA56]
MRESLSETDLRAAWKRLHLVGDYDMSMRHRAVRLAVEAAAHAWRNREQARTRQALDAKRRAANDIDD